MQLFPGTEIASSFSMLSISVFVVIYYQYHKVILDELEKFSIWSSNTEKELALQSGSSKVILCNSFLSLQFDFLSVSWGHKDESKQFF